MDEQPQQPGPEGQGSEGGEPIAAVTKDEKNMAMLAHLLGIFTSVIVPLIIWLLKKEESKFVEDQAREALNMQLTLLIIYALGGLLVCTVVAPIIATIAFVYAIVFGIIAAVRASEGELYRYPITLRLVK
jgi:hypothetical protein